MPAEKPPGPRRPHPPNLGEAPPPPPPGRNPPTSSQGGSTTNASQQKQLEPNPFALQELVPEPPGARYDDELAFLCLLAASVGMEARGPAPLSFTALVIAFLFGEDSVSQWFQGYVSSSLASIDTAAILRSKKASPDVRLFHLERARVGLLPTLTPLFSVSARRMFESAQTFARAETGMVEGEPFIGTRHLMAAYIYRVPSDHRDQVRGWGFDQEDLATRFREFLRESSGREPAWFSETERVTPTPPATTLIGRYTADDPFAAVDDQLDIEDEAAAFARIAAASAIRPPLAIGVFGEWGSGKTYFMKRIYDHIERLKDAPANADGSTPFHREIVQIRFDAWHYIETNLWASLVEYIFTALDRALMEQSGSSRADADRVFERLATAQQLKLDALEDVVARRAERRGAELRAERARREYEAALTRSGVVQPEAYFSALLDTLLQQQPTVKSDLEKIGNALGIDKLEDARARLGQVLAEAKTEQGRAQIIMRSAVAKLGKVRWIIACIAVLVLFPIFATWLNDLAAMKLGWVRTIHDAVVAGAAFLIGATSIVGTLVNRGSAALTKLDGFRKNLETKVEEQRKAAAESGVAMEALDAESELRKRKQALDAAERALAEADARLTAARQDFESASARGRLNAFIRAKVTDGGYAKHLGIIAAIRKDFGQLASLMNDVGDDEARRERERLAKETRQRIDHFMQWLEKTPDVRLSGPELRSLFVLLKPEEAVECFDEWRNRFVNRVEGDETELGAIRNDLEQVATTPLPSFSRIILYIDDLDRCPSKTVVEVLQAVHMLLSFPLFVVVVAVDARWVSRALKKQYPNLLAATSNDGEPSESESGASAHDYMEKIFQIPYWVRAMNPDAAKRYVKSIALRDVASRASEKVVATGSIDSGSIGSTAIGGASRPRPPQGANVGSRPAASSPAPASKGQSTVAGLTLSDWEIQALEDFAGFIGTTPRRAIRFVNIYRLIKTSLPRDLLDTLVGVHGESRRYPALIAQLAIVTGAPLAAAAFFSILMGQAPNNRLETLRNAWSKAAATHTFPDAAVVEQILATLHNRAAEFIASDLQALAHIAQRYSFATPPPG